MIFNEDNSLRFVRSHRAPWSRPRISLINALVSLGVVLLVATGVMINANLSIL